jgi:hypothetical protein
MLSLCLLAALAFSSSGLPATSGRSAPSVQLPGANRDYIFPNEIDKSRVRREQLESEPADGSTVSYTAFDGTSYSLIQYNGTYVAFLVQPASLALNRFSVPQLRAFIDHLDVLYTHFSEIMGAEPPGGKLIHMAFVNTCGGGCGYIGVKGIELAPEMLDPAHTEYPDDSPYVYAIHELTHNFDFYSQYITYGPDPAHSWTDFMTNYISFFNREGVSGEYPVPWLQDAVTQRFTSYLSYPGSNWTDCVEKNSCDPGGGMAQHAQGGMMLRIAQLHGPESVKVFIQYLNTAISTRKLNSVSMDDLAKNDLLIESLAHGAKANLSCYEDAWNWPISSALRGQLNTTFGENPNCADQDGDGYSTLQGDANDHNASINPGAKEVANGIDDDGDGIIDDLLVKETSDFGNSVGDATTVPFPARIDGTIATPQDSDTFQIVLAHPTHVRFILRSLGAFQGWLFLNNQGSSNWFKYEWVDAKQRSILDVDLTAGTWTFDAAYNSQSTVGDYEIVVMPITPWPSHLTAPQAETPVPGVEIMATPAVPPELAGLSHLSARFWVEGFGWYGERPLDSTQAASFTWVAPSGTSFCGRSYRVQFRSGDLPASPTSQPAPFSGAEGGCAEPLGYYKLTVNVSPAAAGSVATDPASMDGTYPVGAKVCFTPTAITGSLFQGWSGDPVDTAGCLTMTTDHVVTALFGAQQGSSTRLPGNLRQISTSADGAAWGLDGTGNIYRYSLERNDFEAMPGRLSQIVAGPNGTAWGLIESGSIYRFDPATQKWQWIRGTLAQIALGADGDVWGINPHHLVYHFDSATQDWIAIAGSLSRIAVGFDGAVWGLGDGGEIYHFNPGSQIFQRLPGSLSQIAVGTDGDVWGINSAGRIYHFDSLRQNWNQVGGSLEQIAVGWAGNIWGINATGQIFKLDSKVQTWSHVQGVLAQITAETGKTAWGLDSDGNIFRFQESSQPQPGLQQLPGLLSQVSVSSDNNAWAIDSADEIFHFNALTQDWDRIPGSLSQVAAGPNGDVWGINSAGLIYRFDPASQSWLNIAGTLTQIQVGSNGDVWGLNSAGLIYRFNPSLESWDWIAGSLASLSVGADGSVWGINSAQQIYRFNAAAQGWDRMPGFLTQIAVGSAGNVWGVNAEGQIYRFDDAYNDWYPVSGVLSQISVAFDGSVWGVNAIDQIYRFETQDQKWSRIPGALSRITVSDDGSIWGLDKANQIYTFR